MGTAGWLLAEVTAGLAAHRVTVWRLLDRHGRVQQRGRLEANDAWDRVVHDLRAVDQDAAPATAGLADQDAARHCRRALDVVWTSPGGSGRAVGCGRWWASATGCGVGAAG